MWCIVIVQLYVHVKKVLSIPWELFLMLSVLTCKALESVRFGAEMKVFLSLVI